MKSEKRFVAVERPALVRIARAMERAIRQADDAELRRAYCELAGAICADDEKDGEWKWPYNKEGGTDENTCRKETAAEIAGVG